LPVSDKCDFRRTTKLMCVATKLTLAQTLSSKWKFELTEPSLGCLVNLNSDRDFVDCSKYQLFQRISHTMDECDSTSTFCSEVVTSKHFSELGTIFEQVEERLPKVVIFVDESILLFAELVSVTPVQATWNDAGQSGLTPSNNIANSRIDTQAIACTCASFCHIGGGGGGGGNFTSKQAKKQTHLSRIRNSDILCPIRRGVSDYRDLLASLYTSPSVVRRAYWCRSRGDSTVVLSCRLRGFFIPSSGPNIRCCDCSSVNICLPVVSTSVLASSVSSPSIAILCSACCADCVILDLDSLSSMGSSVATTPPSTSACWRRSSADGPEEVFSAEDWGSAVASTSVLASSLSPPLVSVLCSGSCPDSFDASLELVCASCVVVAERQHRQLIESLLSLQRSRRQHLTLCRRGSRNCIGIQDSIIQRIRNGNVHRRDAREPGSQAHPSSCLSHGIYNVRQIYLCLLFVPGRCFVLVGHKKDLLARRKWVVSPKAYIKMVADALCWEIVMYLEEPPDTVPHRAKHWIRRSSTHSNTVSGFSRLHGEQFNAS
ncbi:hypothetical protein KCU66_g7, partial [Aureobasidium melanogenum]